MYFWLERIKSDVYKVAKNKDKNRRKKMKVKRERIRRKKTLHWDEIKNEFYRPLRQNEKIKETAGRSIHYDRADKFCGCGKSLGIIEFRTNRFVIK
jgi:hypothetical protein